MYCKFPNFNLYNDHRITIMKTEVLKFKKVQHKRNTRELQEKYKRLPDLDDRRRQLVSLHARGGAIQF